MCEQFHVLPKPGGIFEQDAYVMWLFTQIMEAEGEKAQNDKQKSERETARARAEAQAAQARSRR